MRGSSPRLPTTFQVANNGGIMQGQIATMEHAEQVLREAQVAPLWETQRARLFAEAQAEAIVLIARTLRTPKAL